MSPSGGSGGNVQIMWRAHRWVSLLKTSWRLYQNSQKSCLWLKEGKVFLLWLPRPPIELFICKSMIRQSTGFISTVIRSFVQNSNGHQKKLEHGQFLDQLLFGGLAYRGCQISASWNGAPLCASAGLLRAVRHMNNASLLLRIMSIFEIVSLKTSATIWAGLCVTNATEQALPRLVLTLCWSFFANAIWPPTSCSQLLRADWWI